MKSPLEQSAVPTVKPELGQPMMALLVERGKKKKKKKKNKKEGLLARVIGKFVLGSSAAVGQVGEAVRGAADKYGRKHKKSRERRRSGWSKHLGRNLSSALGELLTRSAKAPSRFARAITKDKKKRKKKKSGDKLRKVLVQPILNSEPVVEARA